MVRLARFERATFGSGDRRSSPAELQAHTVDLNHLLDSKATIPADVVSITEPKLNGDAQG
jgi:hypothetical protein